MLFVAFFILAANFVVPGVSQDLTYVLADAAQGAVWTVGVDPASGITGKCLMNNPILDVCYYGDSYIAGPTSTLPGADQSMGGHIARIDSLTCELEIIAEFATACTAIGCADDRLVFALEGVGIKSIKYDGSDEQDHGSIPGAFIRNIHIDSISQTSYFVDITTSFVYAVDYTVNTANTAVAIGITGAGAVGVTLDCRCTNNQTLRTWYQDEMEEFNMSILPVNVISGATDVLLRRLATKPTLTLGKYGDYEEKLVIDFTYPIEVDQLSICYKINNQIKLELFKDGEDNPFCCDTMRVVDNCPRCKKDNTGWRTATWTPLNPRNKDVTRAEITFGDFQPSLEVKVACLKIWGCRTYEFAPTESPITTPAFAEAKALNILYADCTVETCSINGPFTACPVLYQSTGSQGCLPMCGTTDKVVMHDNQNTIFTIDPTDYPPDVTTITSSAEAVVGMDCFVGFGDPADELCDPNPCLNDGDCIPTLIGYSCICPVPYFGDNCEILCPECDFSTS